VDSLLCQNAQFEDYPVIASIQGSNGIAPDQYDFYGQTLRNTDTQWDFFLLSRDRAPFCPEAAWLAVDN